MDAALGDAVTDISELGVDHPGATDPVYRERRNGIAAVARAARERDAGMPVLDYREEEHATWRTVAERLAPLHEAHACRAYREARRRLPIPSHRLPDLRVLGDRLEREQGFRLAPIEGLVDSRTFIGRLARRTVSCTLYIRHPSRPEYTPEPDVVHEVLGHVPLFADASFADLSGAIGRAALRASDDELARIERLYWYTLEFGLIEEAGGLRAYGAGLLSSSGELAHAFGDEVERRPFRLDEVLATPYDFARMQPVLFVIPSFAALAREVEEWLRGGGSRQEAQHLEQLRP